MASTQIEIALADDDRKRIDRLCRIMAVTSGKPYLAALDSTAIVEEIIAKLRCEYADAVVSRDELERNGISHGASWWDGVLKGLNIAKRVIEECKDGK